MSPRKSPIRGVLRWPARDVPFGRSGLQLDLVLDDDDAATVPCAPVRELESLRVPWWNDRAWRRHVGWLEGIIEDDEREELADLALDARANAWNALWARLADPGRSGSELEAEHMQRIVAADQRFGRFGRGALSDRGRAWIRYGQPDRIESQQDDLSRESRWEIWYYHELRLRLSFIDRHGMGDFRLVEVRPY